MRKLHGDFKEIDLKLITILKFYNTFSSSLFKTKRLQNNTNL